MVKNLGRVRSRNLVEAVATIVQTGTRMQRPQQTGRTKRTATKTKGRPVLAGAAVWSVTGESFGFNLALAHGYFILYFLHFRRERSSSRGRQDTGKRGKHQSRNEAQPDTIHENQHKNGHQNGIEPGPDPVNGDEHQAIISTNNTDAPINGNIIFRFSYFSCFISSLKLRSV